MIQRDVFFEEEIWRCGNDKREVGDLQVYEDEQDEDGRSEDSKFWGRGNVEIEGVIDTKFRASSREGKYFFFGGNVRMSVQTPRNDFLCWNCAPTTHDIVCEASLCDAKVSKTSTSDKTECRLQ